MPRGIAAHYTTSATPTTEPTTGPERRAFRGSAISEVTKPSRRWCVRALTRRRRVQYVKRLRTGGPCRASAILRQRRAPRRAGSGRAKTSPRERQRVMKGSPVRVRASALEEGLHVRGSTRTTLVDLRADLLQESPPARAGRGVVLLSHAHGPQPVVETGAPPADWRAASMIASLAWSYRRSSQATSRRRWATTLGGAPHCSA